MAKEKYHNLPQEEREKQSRDYIESQEPVKPEETPILNPDGGNVPEPKAAPKKVK